MQVLIQLGESLISEFDGSEADTAVASCFARMQLPERDHGLAVLLTGSISSLQYAIATGERRFSIWNPSMIPIKVLLTACLVLMLLQTISLAIKHAATIRGTSLS